MIKELLSLGTLFLLVSLGFAQSNLSVKVTDQNNNLLSGATITIDGKSKQTDTLGIANFSIELNNEKDIAIRHLGYRPTTQRISKGTKHMTVKLYPQQIVTEAAYVYATRAQENAATTFKNIDKETISKTNLGQDIPYLLDQTPGVVIGSDAGAGIGYTSMTIRGSDNQRINVTLNGIPLNDAESMGSFFVNLPDFASSTESIQIQRGIGTSTNGAGAFGASLNIQTDALEATPYAELNNSFGSFNSWKNTIKVGSGLINNKFAVNARLSRIVSDGYVERANSDLKSFYVDAGMYTEKHILKATVFSGKEKTYQAWYGTPEPLLTGNKTELIRYANEAFGLYEGAEYDRLINADRKYNYYTYDNQTDNYIQTHSHLHYTFKPNEKFDFNTALHYTRGAGYYEEYRDEDELAHYGFAPVVIGSETINHSDLVRRRWLDNHFYGLTYSANYRPSSRWNFIIGGAYNQYKGDHYGDVIWARYASNSELGDRYYLNEANKNDFNIYGKADYKITNWLFNLDLQYRNVQYEVDGDDDKIKNLNFDDQLHFFNPKIGATYFLNPNSNLYVSYAYANKEPVRKDYVENPRNEFPKPEKMQNIELGYRFRNDQFNIGSNFYAMLYRDQLIPTGTLNDTGAALRMNIPKSHRIGLELDAAWNISEHFIWGATAALSDNKIKDFVEYIQVYDNSTDWNYIGEEAIQHGNTTIAMSASSILSNNFTYIPVKDLSLTLSTKYISRMYLDNSEAKERSIEPSFVNNLRAIYSFGAFGLKNIDLNLAVNNIFNAAYTTNGYTWGQQFQNKSSRDYYNFYYPQAGTNFMLGVNLRF